MRGDTPARRVKAVLHRAMVLVPLFVGTCYATEEEILVSGRGFTVTESDVSKELAYMPDAVRKAVLSNPARMRALIDDIYRRAALANAALEEGLQNRPDYAYRLKRAELEELVGIALEQQRRSALDRLPNLVRRAQEQYRSHLEDYRTRERVNVRHILLKIPSCDKRDAVLAEIRKLRDRAQAGEDFGELAKEYSDDAGSAERRGELGGFERGEMDGAFAEAAFALTEPGQMSPVVETRFGVHLIQLIERHESRQMPFDEVKDAILTKLKAEYVRGEIEAWRRDLVDPDKAKVDTGAIDQFVSRNVQSGSDQGGARVR
jgi:peptidyl-prolyl cis-trans isomerase C